MRFETPEQEIRKFTARLRALGAAGWPRDAAIAELFCGRGNGLHALRRLGFTDLTGVDLSPALASRFRGPARIVVADCRRIPFAGGCKDVALVQGGLHHLPILPDALAETLIEAHRILRPGGRFVAVEPWRTPFLSVVHAATRVPMARRAWPKLDAFATMVQHEIETYEQWLAQPGVILGLLDRYFARERCVVGWGKLTFVGRKDA